MNITITATEEHEDGSMTMSVDADSEFVQEAIQHYILYLLQCGCDENKKQIKESELSAK